jgi:hypothetical protein
LLVSTPTRGFLARGSDKRESINHPAKFLDNPARSANRQAAKSS